MSVDVDARLWKVFISSTNVGLTGFRSVARRVIDDFRFDGVKCFEPAMMEDYGTQAGWPREVAADAVRECDLLVGVVGIRYGARPSGEQTSFVELEYQTAVEQGISCLMFVLDRYAAAELEGFAPQGEDQSDRQEQFRWRLLNDQVVELDVASEEDFREKLRSALDNWVRDSSFKREMVDHAAGRRPYSWA